MLEYNRMDVRTIFSVDRIVTIYYLEITSSEGESHDFWELLYVDKGDIDLLLGGEHYHIKEGEAIFYPPNVSHSGFSSNSGAKVAIISFECHSDQMFQFANRIIKMSPADKKLFYEIIREGTKYFEIYENGQRLKAGAPEYLLQSIKNHIELLLIGIAYKNQETALRRSANAENHYKGLAQDIYRYLYEHVTQPMTIEQIGKHFSISVSQVKKVFNDEFSCGVIEFFNDIKIETAKNLIRTSDMNFSEISEYLGFNSIHYFSKLFKNKTGRTPSQYSKSIY